MTKALSKPGMERNLPTLLKGVYRNTQRIQRGIPNTFFQDWTQARASTVVTSTEHLLVVLARAVKQEKPSGKG